MSWVACSVVGLSILLAAAGGNASSLRFRGHGGSPGDDFVFPDRVKIDSAPPSTANVGAGDFTIEFFLKAAAVDNPNGSFSCGFGIDWVNGNILIDRDRFGQARKWGIALLDSGIAFGASSDFVDYTLCGSTDVLDGVWHHVAVQRRESDGRMQIWVDGVLDAEGPMAGGPSGDMSYPAAAVPTNSCSPDGGSGSSSCENSDPFLVFGAEKHGFSGINYNGWLDEIRLSNALRYTTAFPRPVEPFTPDADTAALYHLDEGGGATAADAAGSADGAIFTGGSSPAGPEWSADTPLAAPVPTLGVAGAALLALLVAAIVHAARRASRVGSTIRSA
jgi:hypothetical protein